jgi:hypothetical protein
MLLFQLLKAYTEIDKEILPGETKYEVYKLFKIKEKFDDQYKEIIELQKKLCSTLEEYFKGTIYSSQSYFGSTNDTINDYKIDTSFVIRLTIEEIFILYYYTDLFKRNNDMFKFYRSHIVIAEIDNILEKIQKSIMSRIPSRVTFYKPNK